MRQNKRNRNFLFELQEELSCENDHKLCEKTIVDAINFSNAYFIFGLVSATIIQVKS